jgi:hypothetical protein
MNSSMFQYIVDKTKGQFLAHTTHNGAMGGVVLANKTTSNADMKTTGTPAYKIAGVLYTATAQATLSMSTLAASVIPSGYTAMVACLVNAAGTFSLQMGTPVPTTTTTTVNGVTTVTTNYPQLPDFADTYCCVACCQITNGSASNFTPGTTYMDAAGITTVYKDLASAFPLMQLLNA